VQLKLITKIFTSGGSSGGVQFGATASPNVCGALSKWRPSDKNALFLVPIEVETKAKILSLN